MCLYAHAQESDSTQTPERQEPFVQSGGFEGALETLRKESGVQATLEKLRKADEMTGKNSVGTAERALENAGVDGHELSSAERATPVDPSDRKAKALDPLEVLEQVGKLEIGNAPANEGALLKLLSNGDFSLEEITKKYQEFLKNPSASGKTKSVSERLKAETAAKRKTEAIAKSANAEQKALAKNRDQDVVTGGLTFEDALRMLEQESGVNATIRKLKKVDELAGKNSFGTGQQAMREAAEVVTMPPQVRMGDMSPAEKSRAETFDVARKNLRSVADANRFEKAMNDVDYQSLEANGSSTVAYIEDRKRAIRSARSIVGDLQSRGRSARKKFKTLNPDLYYGDSEGETYIGDRQRAVYLPLAKLSFADEVISYSNPDADHGDVADVLRGPDMIRRGMKLESGVYSLGKLGSLTIRFRDNALVNVNGPDLYIFEMGKVEPTNLEISKNGKTWVSVGKIDGGVAEVDIAEFVEEEELFYFVRLTDLGEKSNLPGADIDAIAAIGSAMRLSLESQVLFDSGKSELKPEGVKALAELTKSIGVITRAKIIVEGHTDSVGSPELNRKLSLARARSVSRELKKLITSPNYSWAERGYGAEKPLVDNDSDANRAVNRRVEVLVLPN
jgi:outer membrane protein OmpA-like peptidoglycan-associated protein